MANLTEKQVDKALAQAEETLRQIRGGFKRNIKHNLESDDYRWAPKYDTELIARQKRVGKAVARILAIRGRGNRSGHFRTSGWRSGTHQTAEEYAILDAAIGGKVERESKLSGRNLRSGYLSFVVRKYCGSWKFNQCWRDASIKQAEPERKNLGFVGCKPFYAPEPEPFNVIYAFMHAKAEYDYWQEIKRLMQERAEMKQARLSLRKAA